MEQLGDQYGRSMIGDDFSRQRAKNRELSERLDRMELDRDEQVRRLREAFAREANLIAEPPSDAFRRMLSFNGKDVAELMYDAGARIPDPPRPSLPVVTSSTVDVAFAAYASGEGGSHQERWERTLRAAWPRLLRDSIKALRLGPFDDISNETMHAIFRQLAGEP